MTMSETGGCCVTARTILISALLCCSAQATAAPQDTAPYEFLNFYVHEIGEIEHLRARAEKDATANPEDFMSCIRNTSSLIFELAAAKEILVKMHLSLHNPAHEAPQLISGLYGQRLEVFDDMRVTCTAFSVGPKPGVDYSALSAKAPIMTAMMQALDKMTFTATELVIGSAISDRADSQNHANHLVITRAQRANLVQQIESYFGDSLDRKDAPIAVQGAKMIKEKLNEYFVSDDPWK